MLFSEVISALVDIVLAVLCVRDVAETRILEVFNHHVVTSLHEIHHLVQTVKDRLVEYLSVSISSLKDSSDCLTGITERLQLADDLVHCLDLGSCFLADFVV